MKIINNEISETTLNNNLNSMIEKESTAIDSFTINLKKNKITSFIILNQELYNPDPETIRKYFSEKNNKKHLENRLKLAKLINIPLYLLSFDNDFNFSLTKLSIKEKDLSIEEKYFSLEQIISVFNKLRGYRDESKSKPLMHLSNNDPISILKSNGLNLGGNLDGFFFNFENKTIELIEFSKRGVKTPDFNGLQTKNYSPNRFMEQDFQRWYSLNLLRSTINLKINTTLKIIVWSFNNDYLKIFEKCDFKGENNNKLLFSCENQILFEDKNKKNIHKIDKLNK